MNKTFTRREKILFVILAILLLGCVYYIAVFKPSMETISESQTRLEEAESQLVVEEAKLIRYQGMTAALEQAKSAGAKTSIPDYDNTKAEMKELDSILSSAATYNIVFGEVEANGTIVRRPVSISFTAASYPAARAVLTKLINGKYSCLVTKIGVSIDSAHADSAAPVTASLEAIMFEQADATAAANMLQFVDPAAVNTGSESAEK